MTPESSEGIMEFKVGDVVEFLGIKGTVETIGDVLSVIWDSGLDPTGSIEDQVSDLLEMFELDE